ncbi:MAG: hypothetical protein M3132_05130 [Actinomycetia bacterium]|nr:hypothetical protein [Actinomycetes bacterium]
MPSTPTLADLNEQRQKAVADLANIDHAIASLEALERSHMIDASCPHCDFVVQTDGGIEIHLRDVHPNPLIYPNAQSN